MTSNMFRIIFIPAISEAKIRITRHAQNPRCVFCTTNYKTDLQYAENDKYKNKALSALFKQIWLKK